MTLSDELVEIVSYVPDAVLTCFVRERLLHIAFEAARMERALDEMVENSRHEAELTALGARFSRERETKLRVIAGGRG